MRFYRAELDLYLATLDAEVTPVDGIVEALDEIDIPSCVASSGSHEKLRLVLGRTRLRCRGDPVKFGEVDRILCRNHVNFGEVDVITGGGRGSGG